jgi:hypothetical protein
MVEDFFILYVSIEPDVGQEQLFYRAAARLSLDQIFAPPGGRLLIGESVSATIPREKTAVKPDRHLWMSCPQDTPGRTQLTKPVKRDMSSTGTTGKTGTSPQFPGA